MIPTVTRRDCFFTYSDNSDGICYEDEALDSMHDRISIELGNDVVIPAAAYLVIEIYPVKNFPSMAEVNEFSGWTGDQYYAEIETFSGAGYANTLPNTFNETLSTLLITGSTDANVTDFY